MNTDTELAIANAATPGPWRPGLTDDPDGEATVVSLDQDVANMVVADFTFDYDEVQTRVDIAAICHARNGYPLALAVVESARQLRRATSRREEIEAMSTLEFDLDAWEAAEP